MQKTRYVLAEGFDQPVLINEEDFDPAVHREPSAVKKEKPKGPKPPKEPKPPTE